MTLVERLAGAMERVVPGPIANVHSAAVVMSGRALVVGADARAVVGCTRSAL